MKQAKYGQQWIVTAMTNALGVQAEVRDTYLQLLGSSCLACLPHSLLNNFRTTTLP